MTPVLDIQVQTTLESPGRSFVLDARFASTTSRTALVGVSGSGKSTVLMAIAGLAPQTRGHVRVAGKSLLDTASGIDVPARERPTAIVAQSDLLALGVLRAEEIAGASERIACIVMATSDLLNQLHGRRTPERRPSAFSFRGLRPLFAHEQATLNGRPRDDGGLDLFAANGEGAVTMQATMTWL